jgi:hypothetical protein
VNGDVVVGVDGEGFHVSDLFSVAYSRMDIDHSGRGLKQADSAGNRISNQNRGTGAPMPTLSAPVI